MSRTRTPKMPMFTHETALNDGTRTLIDTTINELLRLAPRAGLSIRDLNSLLDSGLSLEELVEYVAAALLKRAA